jgi:hypothetical protein
MLEIHVVAVCQLQFIPVLRVMTVKTPSHAFRMVKFNICMLFLEFSSLGVYIHACMA